MRLAVARTRTTPRTPCARSTKPTARRSLLEDFKQCAGAHLRSRRAEDGAQRAGGAALLADDLAEVLFGDGQLEDGGAVLFHFLDGDFGRSVDQLLREELHELLELRMVCGGHGAGIYALAAEA